MEISIKTPGDFSFRRTIYSHGWYGLQPFHIDQSGLALSRVLDLKNGKPVTVAMRGTKRAVKVSLSRTVGKRASDQIVKDVRHMLRLDDDLSVFYRRDRRVIPTLDGFAIQGAGRLLRSPTVFEDLVKMICTTNCSWALTVEDGDGIGGESRKGIRRWTASFPHAESDGPDAVKFYADVVRAGYRAPYFKELADRVASGELDVEAWLNSPLSTEELMKEMKGVKGVGPYAAENVLKLIGRYDGLALDSWTRAKFFTVRNKGRKDHRQKDCTLLLALQGMARPGAVV